MGWTRWVVYHPEAAGLMLLGLLILGLSILGATRDEIRYRKERK